MANGENTQTAKGSQMPLSEDSYKLLSHALFKGG